MCQHCYEWQMKWNADKHARAMAARENAPDGFNTCMSCKRLKPADEFQPNPSQRRKIVNRSESRLCKTCRAYKAARRVADRNEMSVEEKAAYLSERRDYSRGFRFKLLDAYGRACRCCGDTTPEFLEIHHKNNDGAAHRREIGRGPEALYWWAKKNNFPPTLETICANCHSAETFYGGCPHKRATPGE
jgi:hypothetical protein